MLTASHSKLIGGVKTIVTEMNIVFIVYISNTNHNEVLSHNQDASFVPKAIDLAARELTSLATPGQGIPTILSWLWAPVS